MSRIFLFGANGMLGRYIFEHLQDDHHVIPITRQDLNLAFCSRIDVTAFLLRHKLSPDDTIINASGIIKQRECSLQDMIMVNSVFPHVLSSNSDKVIHITTDCVFSGKRGEYTESDPHDCLDDYGRTKSLGEPSTATVIRTSIIGEEFHNKRSLLEWAKSQRGGTVSGYTNHTWNGVTCLALAKYIEQLIKGGVFWKGVRHIFSNDISKCDLLRIIDQVYGLGLSIIEVEHETPCHRNLRTIHDPVAFDTIHDQIIELKKWRDK